MTGTVQTHNSMILTGADLLGLWHNYRGVLLVLVAVATVAWTVVMRPTTQVQETKEKEEPVKIEESAPKEQEKQGPAKETQNAAAPLAVDFTTTMAAPKKQRKGPKRFTAASGGSKVSAQRTIPNPSTKSQMKIFYSTLTGFSQKYAEIVHKKLEAVMETTPELMNLDYVGDLDEYFVSPAKPLYGCLYLFVVPSYETESPLDYFIQSLQDTYNDFRIDSRPLQNLGGFSVFGLGDREGWPEEDKFCYQGRQVDKYLGKLGLGRMFPLGYGDIKGDIDNQVDEWVDHLIETLQDPSPPEQPEIVDSDEEEEEETKEGDDVVDVEEMGMIIKRSQADKKDTRVAKEMVAQDSPTYKSLTKQGYKVVGSHSGVKICRWTKSALRGRGSCYKHSLYGIESHLCMETTPSLSCSSKCVFCWRHQTNPVGTEWRWQVDKPEDVIKGAMDGHYKMIKQMRGVPGVKADRFADAFRIRHCALSLVGEPIFYPYINEFVGMLHDRKISSFLVCNAQHPEELRRLQRVTQLYVSIDASNKKDLKEIDRPLHRDFWERFEECLDILRGKTHMRTVFRLTLVKGFNTDDTEGYADMVERARPSFIEVKGATFCGNSKNSPITMQNIPFYEEVKLFIEKLNKDLASRGLEYDIAAEHAHSCCALVADKRFKIDGRWHTHIDYDKFFELLEAGVEFGPMDYIAPTPEWALYGNGGFRPDDVPHRRGKPVNVDANTPTNTVPVVAAASS